MTNIWRINLKPGASDIKKSRDFCFSNNIVGLGWTVSKKSPLTLDEYIKLGENEYYQSNDRDKGWWPAINAIGNIMQKNDLVWTRDTQGIYYLGRITGDWEYRDEKEFLDADIVNIRSCKWIRIGTIESVPGKIVNSFIPQKTLQRVLDEGVKMFSYILYNKFTEDFKYIVNKFDRKDLYSLISSDDCEDAVSIYLQSKYDYMMIPSSCKISTMNYEFVFINKNTQTKAVAQVKNGFVDLETSDYDNLDCDVFLFTSKGKVNGVLNPNIKILDGDELLEFIFKNLEMMPSKIKEWINVIIN